MKKELLRDLNPTAKWFCGVLYVPTHSIRLICLATVLWTRKGRPEPLPDVHEWSNRS